MPIRIVRPIDVTPAMLLSSSVPENDADEWDSAVTYNTGQRVMVRDEHTVYASLIDSNINKAPATNADAWLRVGATNRWRAFDRSVGNRATHTSAITYRLALGRSASSIAALDVRAASVTVRVLDKDVETEAVTVTTTPPLVESTWYAYLMVPCVPMREIVIRDLSITSDATVEVTVTPSAGSNAELGELVLGNEYQFGAGVEYGATTGILDFSRKARDDFGTVTLVERSFAKRASFTTHVSEYEADAVQSVLADIRATPCVWIGYEAMTRTIIYGFFRDFDLEINLPAHSRLRINLEGLT